LRLLAATLRFAVLAPACLAQTTRPAQDFAALRPAMIRLQSGGWELDSAKSVIKALVDGGRLRAARWWIDLAEAAVKQTSLPASASLALAAFRREVDAKAALPDDLKTIRRLVRHAESASASRNYIEAERLCALARVLLELVPDAAASKALATLEKTLQGQPRQDADHQNLQRQKKESAPTETAAQDMIKTALALAVADYEIAGVRPARVAILKALDGPASGMDEKQRQALAARVRAASRDVEPTKTVTVFMRGAQRVQVLRDGAVFQVKKGCDSFDSAEDDGFDLQVLEGEIIQLRPEPRPKLDPEKATLATAYKWAMANTFAVAALLDGKELPKNVWFRAANDSAGSPDPKLVRVPFGRKGKSEMSDIPEGLPDEVKEHANRPWLTFDESASSSFGTAFTEDHEKIEASLRARGLSPFWIGTSAKQVTSALKVPDFR
jgi:hypothetical protein